MSPDEHVLRTHLECGPFQNGVDRQRWWLCSIDWPYVFFGIKAQARAGSPNEYLFRFDCCDYPSLAPTARLWDVKRGMPLEQKDWPTGKSRVLFAFNPQWRNGQCLYLPCDRLSFEGHDVWRTQHPSMIWSPTSDITLYLRIIYELLNSNDYTGTRGSIS